MQKSISQAFLKSMFIFASVKTRQVEKHIKRRQTSSSFQFKKNHGNLKNIKRANKRQWRQRQWISSASDVLTSLLPQQLQRSCMQRCLLMSCVSPQQRPIRSCQRSAYLVARRQGRVRMVYESGRLDVLAITQMVETMIGSKRFLPNVINMSSALQARLERSNHTLLQSRETRSQSNSLSVQHQPV